MQLEAHLLGCEGCRDELHAMKAVLSSVAALPAPDPSPGFAGRLHARIQDEKRRTRVRWFRPSWLSPAWAAVLVFLVATGGVLWTLQPGGRVPLGEAGKVEMNSHEPPRRFPVDPAGETGEMLLKLWPSGAQDLAVLVEGRDRSLMSLALGSGEVNPDEAVRIWTSVAPGRRATDVFADLAGLSEQGLESLLARWVKG